MAENGLLVANLYKDISSKPVKLLFSQLVFGSVGEIILGLGLIYQFRLFERRSGSSKFISFSFLSTVTSLVLQMCVLFLGFETQRIAAGPYSYIFAWLVHYFSNVPKLQVYKFFGLELSDKTFVYFWTIQMLFSRGRESMVPGICGFVGGVLCMTPFLPLSKFAFPTVMSDFFETYVLPIVGSSPVTGEPVNQAAGGERLVPLNNDHIESLVQMGFPRPQVIQVLRMTNNNVERAAEILLNQS